jgi:hypothetical protein
MYSPSKKEYIPNYKLIDCAVVNKIQGASKRSTAYLKFFHGKLFNKSLDEFDINDTRRN